jgi:hypothetical protein
VHRQQQQPPLVGVDQHVTIVEEARPVLEPVNHARVALLRFGKEYCVTALRADPPHPAFAVKPASGVLPVVPRLVLDLPEQA